MVVETKELKNEEKIDNYKGFSLYEKNIDIKKYDGYIDDIVEQKEIKQYEGKIDSWSDFSYHIEGIGKPCFITTLFSLSLAILSFALNFSKIFSLIFMVIFAVFFVISITIAGEFVFIFDGYNFEADNLKEVKSKINEFVFKNKI